MKLVEPPPLAGQRVVGFGLVPAVHPVAVIAEPPSKAGAVQESATCPSPAIAVQAGGGTGRPGPSRRAVDRDVETLEHCIDRVGDRQPVAAGEEQSDRLVPALRDEERARVAGGAEGCAGGIENWLT